MSPRFLSDPQQTAVLYGKLSLISHHIYDKSLDSVEAFRWCHQESNRGHKDFQSFALPTELWHLTASEGLSPVCECKVRNFFSFHQIFCYLFFVSLSFFRFYPIPLSHYPLFAIPRKISVSRIFVLDTLCVSSCVFALVGVLLGFAEGDVETKGDVGVGMAHRHDLRCQIEELMIRPDEEVEPFGVEVDHPAK